MGRKKFKAPNGIVRLNFSGVSVFDFADKYYGTFYNDVISPCNNQGLYILILLELFYDTKF